MSLKMFNKRIWSIEDLMEVTGYSRQTIYNLKSQKRIPFRKKFGKLFFIPDEILNWIEEGESHE